MMKRLFSSLTVCVFALSLVCLTGCRELGWTSIESVKGKKLQVMQERNSAVKIATPDHWAIRLKPITIQKRYSDRNGTQFRAVTHWELTDSIHRLGPRLEQMAKEVNVDASNREVVKLHILLRYFDATGKSCGDESIEVRLRSNDRYLRRGLIPLERFAKVGSPAHVTATLQSVSLVPQEVTSDPSK